MADEGSELVVGLIGSVETPSAIEGLPIIHAWPLQEAAE
jgi:hypothetical protein